MNDPAKNDILIAESSYERIAGPLSDRLPEVRSICWHPDGSLTLDGRPVDTGAVNPVAGWISFDVLLGGHIESYAAAVGSFDSLEWLQSANAGLDHPVYPPLASRGVRLTKSGSQSIPITEYVIANVLYRYQRIEDRRTAEASKRWSGLPFRELWHTTWLTVGFGHIGRGVARRARGFECKVIAIRRTPGPDADADVVAPPSSLPELLPEADVVVLACPATNETQRMPGADFFSQMKEGSLLVNVARGSLIDDDALLAGLSSNRPAHAVLDVFDPEPLPPASPYWEHPQVTVTAHLSNAGNHIHERGAALFLDNLSRFLEGAPLLDEVSATDIAAEN